MLKKRKNGNEQPFIPLGIFKVRIPFIHFGFEKIDFFQGLLLCAICMGAIPMLQDYLGMSFNVAMTVVVFNGFFYFLHVLFGDPIIPGWITPAIPIVMLYLKEFPIGIERTHALIAFQISLGIISIFLGITGFGRKVTSIVPNAMKSGIIIGAGIAAVNSIMSSGGNFEKYPFSIVICTGVGFYFLFSSNFKSKKDKNRITKILFDLGSLPIIIVAIFVGPLFKEISIPQIHWGITSFAFQELIDNWTIFGIGIPPFKLFIKGLPIVLSTYIILFGDMIQAQCLLENASKERPDEIIDYNSNRSHIIFGMRNVLMGLFSPTLTLCGPLAAAMQVVLCERYKNGEKTMNTIHAGAMSYRYGTFCGYFFLPIVTLVKPILGIALATTMLIQGFVSVRVGVTKSKTINDLGIAGIMSAIIAFKGASWGITAGIILCLFVNLGKNNDFESLLIQEFDSRNKNLKE
ncbi:MAG: hypothetical protein ACRCZI_05645 [Cetobacterium sp.]